MNIRLIDGWTFLHFITTLSLSLFLLLKEIELIYVTIIIVFVIIIYEILEHSFIGDLVFEWVERERKEILHNSIIDIIVGIIGLIISIILIY